MLGQGALGAVPLGGRALSASAPITIDAPLNGATVGNQVAVIGSTSTAADVEYRVGAGSWGKLATPSGGNYSGVVTGLTAGSRTIEVRQSDAVANTASVSLTVVDNSINITSPVPYKLFRRGVNTTADVVVTFAYLGVHSGFEARCKRSVPGAWQSFAGAGPNPRTITLSNEAIGVFEVEVRSADDAGVIDTVTPIAVGRAIGMVGQSNSSGRGTNNQTAPASGAYLYDNTGAFRALADPYDGNFGGSATYSALDDGASAAGSYAPRIATKFAAIGEPILLIPANKGGTQISDWSRNLSTATLYGAMRARFAAAGGVDAVHWHQGEADIAAGTSESTYAAALTTLVGNLRSDFGACPVFIALMGYGDYAAVRAAQLGVIADGLGAYSGGDVLPFGGLHLTSDAELSAYGDKAAAAMLAVLSPLPTLSLPTYVPGSITSSGFRPRVTAS